MKPLTPTERWAEHRGDISALTGVSAISAFGSDPPARHPSALIGGTSAIDVHRSAPPAMTEGSFSGEPGRRSSLTAEQYAESDRIQQMVFAHRARMAERERLAAEVDAEQWR